MNYIKYFSIFFFIGCAKIGYMYDQSTGYLKLLYDSKTNDEVLRDKNIPDKYKAKIKKIMEYKKYFYDFFDEKPTGIYSETTLLKKPAVTYLVIASRYNEIKAAQFDFPLIGSFPYIGFFDPKKASEKEQELQQQDYVTYQRPVYAFSTLGYFEDRILSSFFYFDDFNLSELVFHELFHTIFFMKNDVDTNENLANYFGKELALIYFKDQSDIIKVHKLRLENNRKISSKMQKLTLELEKKYAEVKDAPRETYQRLLEDFIEHRLYPEIKALCHELKVADDDCYPINSKWNNAKLAAYKSYEKSIDIFESLNRKLNIDLKQYYQLLKEEYKQYTKLSKVSFEDYLKKKYNL